MPILIVDDDDIALELLQNTLEDEGYEVESANNGYDALEKLRSGRFQTVVSDWEMDIMDGVQLCREVRKRCFSSYIYFILVTGRTSTKDVVEGLDAGADDFIAKPFEPAELCVRLRVGERIRALESRNGMIFALAKLAESRDTDTGSHLDRIRDYCRVLAQQLSTLPAYRDIVDGDYIQTLYQTSPLHDIGKVGIPDNILLKPGKLTEEEFAIMKTHVEIGAETLAAVAANHPGMDFLDMALELTLSHHERFDGSGYPQGLVADEIPLSGRILALADVYDAITTERVYKKAATHDVARSVIVKGRGAHFDPDIVDAFLAVEKEFIEIKSQFESTNEITDYPSSLQVQLAV
ncbi:Cyclic di-GMP phosphodiesterase response regulator RpfG [Symmachiella dynata]|uniref:Cyclic di-GMP phosphodiesterase response regulator RpfG n=1 Tax=Symmachiella dynata TaxID=2527995 RepID=A0A517ZQH5_9PLAN|nr:HD domain-containing phosphohydrolase [Symmachiella dynata]QDT49074.1 Cyclic di-GMP phosphodiesterase response regulator RpfG [Symmachiella dynata]QDU44741.1 Cyclic di-GMP phosphodiesterase response regulator RpfG [Symmachiella dynata]